MAGTAGTAKEVVGRIDEKLHEIESILARRARA